jgi:hypothetical protein
MNADFYEYYVRKWLRKSIVRVASTTTRIAEKQIYSLNRTRSIQFACLFQFRSGTKPLDGIENSLNVNPIYGGNLKASKSEIFFYGKALLLSSSLYASLYFCLP